MSLGSGAGKVQETPAQKEAANVALQHYAEYKRIYRPAENKFIARTQGNYESDKGRSLATAGNATDAAFAGAGDKVASAMQERGVGLGGGKSTAVVTQALTDQATSRGLGLTSAREAVEDKHQGDIAAITQIGKGQAAQASQGYSTLASLSEAQARNDAQIAADNASGGAQLIGTGIGLAAGSYGRSSASNVNPAAASTTPDAQGLTRTKGGLIYNFPGG